MASSSFLPSRPIYQASVWPSAVRNNPMATDGQATVQTASTGVLFRNRGARRRRAARPRPSPAAAAAVAAVGVARRVHCAASHASSVQHECVSWCTVDFCTGRRSQSRSIARAVDGTTRALACAVDACAAVRLAIASAAGWKLVRTARKDASPGNGRIDEGVSSPVFDPPLGEHKNNNRQQGNNQVATRTQIATWYSLHTCINHEDHCYRLSVCRRGGLEPQSSPQRSQHFDKAGSCGRDADQR